jgi:hypothetical protein
VFLYRDTPTLVAAFKSVQQFWRATGNWRPSHQSCNTSAGTVWKGGPVEWRHSTGALGGFRACYSDPSPLNLMVWTHMSNNGTPQADHYDTLVTAGLTNKTTLPIPLRQFWRYNRSARWRRSESR